MKRVRTIGLFLFCTLTIISGQVPSWDWARALHSPDLEIATDVVVDPSSGDIFLVDHLIFQINNQLAADYSYDRGFGKVGGYMGGSHEITIPYDFRYMIDVIGPRYF